jgi:hypothetical protein
MKWINYEYMIMYQNNINIFIFIFIFIFILYFFLIKTLYKKLKKLKKIDILTAIIKHQILLYIPVSSTKHAILQHTRYRLLLLLHRRFYRIDTNILK